MSEYQQLALTILTSLGIGALIGTERERGNQRGEVHFAGIRSFTLIGLLGALTAIISDQSPAIAIVISGGVVGLSIAAYLVDTRRGDAGITTEVAFITTFLLGMLSHHGGGILATAIAVLVTLILSLKVPMHRFAGTLSRDEFYAIVKLTVAASLIVPLLPREPLDAAGILVPFQIGITILLVLALNFFGYFFSKFWDAQRSVLATGVLGGLVSSTVVTWSLAGKSRSDPARSSLYACGTVLAILVMVPRIILLSYTINQPFGSQLLIVLLPVLATGALTCAMLARAPQSSPRDIGVTVGNPFEISEALKFGAFFVVILYGVYVARTALGETGLLLASAIGGIADMDAITLSLSQLHRTASINHHALTGVLIAMNVNNLVKLTLALVRGSHQYRILVLRALAPVILVGVAVLYLLGDIITAL